jgi:hypothetical protein
MKLRAPEGCSSVSHCGHVLQVEADGSLYVEDDVAETLAAHGFSPWQETKPRDIGVMTRDELIMQVMDLTLQTLRSTETEAIRERLNKAQPVDTDLPDETASAGVTLDTEKLCEKDLESLNRPALFALLRKKGVRVVLPVTNAELRAAAKRALDE